MKNFETKPIGEIPFSTETVANVKELSDAISDAEQAAIDHTDTLLSGDTWILSAESTTDIVIKIASRLGMAIDKSGWDDNN